MRGVEGGGFEIIAWDPKRRKEYRGNQEIDIDTSKQLLALTCCVTVSFWFQAGEGAAIAARVSAPVAAVQLRQRFRDPAGPGHTGALLLIKPCRL